MSQVSRKADRKPYLTAKAGVPALEALVSPLVLDHLTGEEKAYLTGVFDRFAGFPSLEQMWQLMDEQWIAFDCDPQKLDGRVTEFYRHPVWMLNGLFIEQHDESVRNRRVFADWIAAQRPRRVADFGGGFGGLARFVGDALPGAEIQVVEPYPHPAAIALADNTDNVRCVPQLSGTYDVLIATDVFEHVPDPLALAAETAKFLRPGGQYLIANCFQPVILCHLPQLFHFSICWDPAMRALGLMPGERVQYGRGYQRQGDLDLKAARKVGECARHLYPWVRYLPKGRAKIGSILTRWMCR